MAKNTISYTTGKTADEQANTLTKDEMVAVLVILLDMDGFEGQLAKLSLPALVVCTEAPTKTPRPSTLLKMRRGGPKDNSRVLSVVLRASNVT